MTTRYEEGARICGHAIICRARKITDPQVVPRSGRHKTQEVTARRDAEAWIDTVKESVRDVKNRPGR